MSVAENLLFGAPVGPAFQPGQHRHQPLSAQGAGRKRPRPRACRCRPAHRRDHGRTVRRPAAGPPLLRAVQLHPGRGSAGIPGATGHARARSRRRPAAGRSRPRCCAGLPLYRGAPSPGPDRCRSGDAAARGPARASPQNLPDDLKGAVEFYDSSQLHRRRHGAGQHAVRPPGLWPGPGRLAHRQGDRPRWWTSWACARRCCASASTTRSALPASA